MPCYFCQKNTKEVNAKDSDLLKNFMDDLYRIKTRRKNRLCARHQKEVSKAIKKSRQLGLLPFTPK